MKQRAETPAAGRFLPGALLAGRYRMVGLLGRGGMGEVYRADDLKVGQQVALKFLPVAVERDPELLDRFLTEVRLSLRVTHPNVCRVFDIGEIDGRHFLSMEFVDGEDLASLLRRIGRLPEDKAVEIARQLCAGLGAAHDEGVLHRDLKPANIMIDGRGRAKITDFGLAGATDGISGRDAKAGTPQYMAPEQVSGGSLSERTDIYALGLVLYELFTGKRAFETRNLDDLERLSTSTPINPASHVSGLNVLVERAILRCLDPDPAKRPQSVAALAASLPGGDPLAMALAAGDTPSPEMVAAAGSDTRLRPAVAWALLGLALTGMVVNSFLSGRISTTAVGAPDKPPAVLVERADKLLKDIGFPAHIDSAWGFEANLIYLSRKAEQRAAYGLETRTRHAQYLWYRESPFPFERFGFISPGLLGTVWPWDPVQQYAGQVTTRWDRDGQLVFLEAVPTQGPVQNAAPIGAVDWSVLFTAAGYNLPAWRPAAPEWTPLHFADERIAWAPAGDARYATRIEAASFRGRPVFFQVRYPWTISARDTGSWRPPELAQPHFAFVGFVSLMLLAAVLVARRNLRLDRADRRGALRLALVAMFFSGISRLLGEHHVPTVWELYLILMAAGYALLIGAVVAACYLAVEPFVRRIWPAIIISWSRLMSGAVRDPLVARDVLIGCAATSVIGFVMLSAPFAEGAATGILPLVEESPAALMGGTHFIGALLMAAVRSVVINLMHMLVLVGWRQLLRREWLAIGAAALMMAALNARWANMPMLALPFHLAAQTMVFVMLARVGVVAGVAALFVHLTVTGFALTWPLSSWHSTAGLVGTAVAVAIALVAFRLATAPVQAPARAGARLVDSRA